MMVLSKARSTEAEVGRMEQPVNGGASGHNGQGDQIAQGGQETQNEGGFGGSGVRNVWGA